ncbi:MAG TPA: tRNA pseudouridine(55) synthase TruB [Solirubrobacterales bacterium]|nr:tRNA pseudouridine(55) synthase TruB [Solirubrobacterales bacterium]
MGAEDVAAVLLCDKPAGITSHDLVARVRRERRAKTGHAGTLDPFATGLLVVLLGRATRLQRYLLGLPKTYLATARLGWRSSTGDPDGDLTETGRVPQDLELPTGRIRQRVPMTSAVKVGGERLYKRAHRGEDVETPEREVLVHRAELLERKGDRATYEIECSSGTYVRTLVESLGDAYCESLRRTAVGPLKVEDAGMELTPGQALSFMPERNLNDEEAARARNGVAVASRQSPVAGQVDERVRLMHQGRLLAVARLDGEELRPEVVLG